MRGRVVGLVILSLLAACGSEGRVAQPEDDFLDKVEAGCRTASKEIDKLDFDVPDADDVDQYVEFLGAAVEVLRDLEPPPSLTKDFDDLVASFDDQVSEAIVLGRAIDDGDTAGIDTAAATMTELGADSDRSADSLGALRCKALAPSTGFVATAATTPIDTTPIETTPIETTPIDTTPIDTTPIDTAPLDTTPIDTTPATTGDEIYPLDLDLTAVAPEGYFWVDDYEQSDSADLYAKSILGPLITSYAAGRVENVAEGHTASIFVITLSAEWTKDAIDQYLFWEGVHDGVDVVTPAGYPVRQKLEAFTETDCLAYYTGTVGISVCTFSGVDGLVILDGFIAAQPG